VTDPQATTENSSVSGDSGSRRGVRRRRNRPDGQAARDCLPRELSFRFQSDEVTDAENNAGREFQPVTTQCNREFPFFGGTEPAVESTLSAAGYRGSDADAYTASQTARIDVVVQDVTRPATLVDRLPAAWTIVEGDAGRLDGERVDLGPVEPRGGPVVRTCFAEAPSEATATGDTEFGPAEAVTDDQIAQVGGTDTNAAVGVDQSDAG